MPCLTTHKEATRFAATANRSILWADQRHTFESPRHARPSAARHHPALLSGSGPQRLPDPGLRPPPPCTPRAPPAGAGWRAPGRARAERGALQGLRAGQVRLATSDAFANDLVPRLCVEFQRTHTGIQFSVISLPTAQVPGAVRSGAADIGLCFSRAPHQDIEVAYRQT